MLPQENSSKLSKAESARINGARSRGPATDLGRLNSANANLKHGAFSKRTLMNGESSESYDFFRSAFCEYFQPADPFEAECVDAMVSARWRIRRLEAMETTLLDHALLSTEATVAASFEAIDSVHQRGLAVHSQIESLEQSSKVQERLQRMYDRNYRLLAAHRRNTGRTVPAPNIHVSQPTAEPAAANGDLTSDPNSAVSQNSAPPPKPAKPPIFPVIFAFSDIKTPASAAEEPEIHTLRLQR